MSERVVDDRPIAEQIARWLLSDPPANPTKQVIEWGRRQAPPITDPTRALEAYRDASRGDRARVRDLMRQRLATDDGAIDVLSVVNVRGVPTAVRLSALDQVQGHLSSQHVAELARVSARQHPPVVLRARDLLIQIGSAEAAYALVKVLGRRPDEAGRLARQAGMALLKQLPAVEVLTANTSHSEVEGENLLYAALTMASDDRAGVSAKDVRTTLEVVAVELDSELQAAGRTAAGLNDYEQLLRDDLHAFVLEWRLAAGEALEARAVETILRSGGAEAVAAAVRTAGAGPAATIARRALDPVRRRQEKFAGQAVGAAHGLAFRDDVRGELRAALVEVLSDDDDELRAGALEALASDLEELPAQARREVAAAYVALSDDRRAEIAARLGSIATEIGGFAPAGALAAWVASATSEDVRTRVDTAAARLATGELGADEATAVLEAVIAALPQAGGDRPALERSVAAAVLSAGSARENLLEPMLDVRPAAAMVAERLSADDLLRLTAGLRRRLLSKLVRADAVAWLNDDRLASTSPAGREALEVGLAAIAEQVIAEWEAAAGKLDRDGAKLLQQARLAALARVLRELERAQAAEREASVEALVSRREAILAALEEAEVVARGNAGLIEQLEVVRDAVGTVGEPDRDQDRRVDVEHWLADTAGPIDDVEIEDGRVVVVRGGPDVVSLTLDADRHAHAGSSPPAMREAFRAVIEQLVDGLVEAGYGPDGTHWSDLSHSLRGRGELVRMVWSRWAATVREPELELARRLVAPKLGPDDVPAIDALVRLLPPSGLPKVVAEIPAEGIAAATTNIGALLRPAARARDTARSRLARGEEEATRRLAERLRLPFRSIESTLFAYFRLRSILADAGWRQVGPSLGDTLGREQLDPESYDVRGDVDADEFVVRTLGIAVGTDVVERVIVEGIKRSSETRDA